MPSALTLVDGGQRTLVPVGAKRLARAKAAYTTRRVALEPGTVLAAGPDVVPRAGDLVLATVTAIGEHKRLELRSGRRAHLFPGDEVIVCYANRYAPDQYEAEVPEDLGPCQLAAAGGVAARTLSRHASVGEATQLEPIGLLCHPSGDRVSLADWSLAPVSDRPAGVPTIAVVGTSMNAGKTTTAAGLARGLGAAGLRVGAAKVTGTGAGGDLWLLHDSGADPVLDFTAAGLASTYREPIEAIEDAMLLLRDHLVAGGAEAIVLEIADGIYQEETAALICGERFRAIVDRVLFAAGDALGATAGVAWLRHHGIPIAAVSGLLSASPLAAREASAALDVPVHDLDALGAPGIAAALGARTVARTA